MISKKLIHQVVTFLNNYLGVKNVIYAYTYYGKDYISVSFNIWSIKGETLCKCIAHYDRYISTENDFNSFKEKVIKNFNNDLATAKEQSDF